MPTISRFYGITIRIFHQEPHRLPHFHARYGGESAVFAIESLTILTGSLPPRAARMVRQWARQHKQELLSNWERARRGELLKRIEPLR